MHFRAIGWKLLISARSAPHLCQNEGNIFLTRYNSSFGVKVKARKAFERPLRNAKRRLALFLPKFSRFGKDADMTVSHRNNITIT
jgi:hypothetical protein